MTERRVPFIFLNLGHTYDHLFMLLYPTVVLVLEREWQRDYGELLSLSLAGFIAFGAGTLPAGWLGDRWSRTGMLTVFFIGIGTASILTGFARSPFEIGAGLALIGLFASIYHPVGIAMVVEGRAKVGRALGVNGVFGNMGVAGAALVAGALADVVGWRAAFMVPGVVAIATGLVFAYCARRAGTAAAATTSAPGRGHSRNAQIRVFVALVVATLCGGVIFAATTVAMPKVFAERLAGMTTSTIGIGGLVSVVYAVAAFAQIGVGNLIDRRPVKSVFVAIVLLQAPLLFIAAPLHGPAMLAAAFAVMVLVFGEIPIHDALVAYYADPAWRSRVYAVKYVLSFGVSAVAVPLVAFSHGTAGGFEWLFLALAALAVAVVAAASILPGTAQIASSSPRMRRSTSSDVL
jgi:MFS family permease